MTPSLVGFLVLLAACLATFGYWHAVTREHNERLNGLDLRVHVNGIRGKSTVTRLVAGVLREGGYVTVAKTTGSAARVIAPDGVETPIKRRGAPTINEQIDIVADHVTTATEALVMECMAVRPINQTYSQDFLVRSDVTVITNVREDHQEEMGETLEEIADSLSRTIPEDGVLITAEDREHLRERLRANAHARGSRLVYADPASVTDADMRGFDYIQYKENVAIGLEMARLAGIHRDAAIAGMWKAVPDVGAVRLQWYEILGKRVLWVPLFAANDKESVVRTIEQLDRTAFPEGATVIGILNNRQDRGRRAELFAELTAHELEPHLDEVITMGAYEEAVTRAILDGGFPAERLHALGETVQPDLQEILERIAGLIDGDEGVLIGMVNIHTEQAELLIGHFQDLTGAEYRDHIAESRDRERAPRGVARLHRAATRTVSSPPEEEGER